MSRILCFLHLHNMQVRIGAQGKYLECARHHCDSWQYRQGTKWTYGYPKDQTKLFIFKVIIYTIIGCAFLVSMYHLGRLTG